MTCPSAIAGTANKAVTKRYFDPSLHESYSFRRVESSLITRAGTVGLPGVASGNHAPAGIWSIGSPDAASIRPLKLKNEMSVVASYTPCPSQAGCLQILNFCLRLIGGKSDPKRPHCSSAKCPLLIETSVPGQGLQTRPLIKCRSISGLRTRQL